MNKELEIYKIITKKSYNREEPNLKNKVIERIKSFVINQKPIKLVGFWGVGFKSKPNWADMTSCEFLDNLNFEVKKVYSPGIEFIFIFANQHGIHNGISKDSIISYTKNMEKIFRKFGFNYIYLDYLWKQYNISFEKIDRILKNKPKGWWCQVENHLIIEKNAENRNLRLSPKEGAQKYYIMRDIEKEMIEKEFSDSIFHAFADPRLKSVLPDMPTLYFYSRKGWSDTPWFVTKDKKVIFYMKLLQLQKFSAIFINFQKLSLKRRW